MLFLKDAIRMAKTGRVNMAAMYCGYGSVEMIRNPKKLLPILGKFPEWMGDGSLHWYTSEELEQFYNDGLNLRS